MTRHLGQPDNPEGHEPDHHHRAEQVADPLGAPPLHGEQQRHDDRGERQHQLSQGG